MIVAAAVLLLGVGPLDGDDDLRLAVGLARRGWIELAEELCERVRQDPGASAKARLGLPLALAEVGVERARRATTPAEAIRTLEGPIAALRAEAKPSLDVRTTLGWVLGQKAKILLDGADREEVPGLEEQAVRALVEVQEYQKTLIGILEKLPSDRETELALVESRFELSRAMLARAKRPGMADPPRRVLLKEAMDGFINLQYDLTGPGAWEAQVDEARCLLELGEVTRAEGKFQGIVDLQRLLPMKMDPMDPRALPIQQATLGLAQAWLRLGKGRSVLGLVDAFLARNPHLRRAAIGLALDLEKASAIQAVGNAKAALALAMAVNRLDPGGLLGREARSRMRSWGGWTPEVLLGLADSEYSAGRPREALALARTCLEVSISPGDKASFEPRALFKAGECLQQLGRPLEAVAAFEQVFRSWPAHELAARAGVEAARGMAREGALTGNRSDRDRLEGLLGELKKRGIGGDLTGILQAEMAEQKGLWREAADLYGGIEEKSGYFERAMISSAYCYRRDAARRWESGKKDPAIHAEVAAELRLAEMALRRVLRKADAGPLTPVAWRELAGILLHETIRRPAEALECLDRAGSQATQDEEGRLRTRELAVQAHLAAGHPIQAAEIVEQMLKESPDRPTTARACRSIWRALDRIPSERRRTATLTRRWLDLVREPGASDLMEAAEVLYRAARDLNGFGEGVEAFPDLRDRTLKDRTAWEEAAFVHRKLVELPDATLDSRDRLVAEIRLARSLAFLARDDKEWEQSKAHYDAIIGSRKLVGPDGRLDPKVLQAQPTLLAVYLELGETYFELGKRGQKFQFENAVSVFSNVLPVLRGDTAVWWRSKYRMIATVYERGGANDGELARILLENLERVNPEFDAGKFGMQPKFEELRDRIRRAPPPGK